MKHAIAEILEMGQLSATGRALYQANGAAATQGRLLGWGTTVGNGIQGWAKGALFFDLDAAAGARLWTNDGTVGTASWVAVPNVNVANTWAAAQTFSALATATLGIVETNLSKVRSATQTVSDTTTLAADDTLVATLVAGAKYIFDINYNFTTINSSGLKMDLNGGTATMTAIQGNALFLDADATPPAIMNFVGALAFTSLTPTLTLTACGLAVQAHIWGGLVCNAAGTFIPQFAQNAETGAAESVIAAIGSSMKLTRVG